MFGRPLINDNILLLKSQYRVLDTPDFAYPYNNLKNQLHRDFSNCDEIKSWLINDVTRHFSSMKIDADNIGRIIDTEIAFVEKVSNSAQLWQKENIKLVLWDIDETLGSYTSNGKWYFRPCILPLMAMLKENLFELKHGILTARSAEAFNEDKGRTMTIINSVGWFWDRQHFYSSRNSASWSEAQHFADKHGNKWDSNQKETIAKKALAANQLSSNGLRFAWIDDFNLSSLFKPELFCYVGDCSPQEGLQIIDAA